MNQVELVHLRKQYATFSLDDVHFSIPAGYITGLIGRNGMGKTTTIKSILSLIHYDGQIHFPSRRTPFDNQRIGVIMDDSFLSKDWNMRLVNQAMRVGYDQWDADAFFRYLAKFEIERSQKVKELSRGMKIKLMLAVALSHKAELLILDEPTSGLDPSMREEFAEILLDFMEQEGHTVLFSTHITQDLEAIADYIVFLDRGKVALAREKEEFIRYFMLLKGAPDERTKLPAEAILGRKTGKYGVELLVRRDALDAVPAGLTEDQVSIDRIMVLYGREMA